MGFLKQFIENKIVYIISEEIVDDTLIDSIAEDINLKHKVCIDMKNVKSLNSPKFIKYLNSNMYKLCNLQNEVLTYLAIVIKDGKLKSYMNFNDFKDDKRELIRRRFVLT